MAVLMAPMLPVPRMPSVYAFASASVDVYVMVTVSPCWHGFHSVTVCPMPVACSSTTPLTSALTSSSMVSATSNSRSPSSALNVSVNVTVPVLSRRSLTWK